MTTTLKSIIAELSPDDQLYVEEKAERLAQEMITHAESLAQVRAALMKTQDEVARILNIKQNAIAQLEKRSDLLISTLRKYVEAMGGELAVAVRMESGNVIMLDSLSSLAMSAGDDRKSTSGRGRKTGVAGAGRAKSQKSQVRSAPAGGR